MVGVTHVISAKEAVVGQVAQEVAFWPAQEGKGLF